MLPLVLAFLAVTGAPMRSEGQTVFPARTVTSPARGYSLYFEPHVTNGLRGADYRMTETGASSTSIAWKGRREFTLRDPIVTDRGWTYGWAIVHGPGENEHAPGGVVHLVAIDAQGRTAVDERIDEVPRGTGCMGPAGGPWILHVVPNEAADALVVILNMTERNGFDEEVWVLDLSTGKRIAAFTPFPSVHDDRCTSEITRLADVTCVRDTPLVLVHATRIRLTCPDGGTFGFSERWAVYDTHGKRVWALDDVEDPRVSEYQKALEIRRQLKPEVTSDRPGVIAFRMQRTKERVTLQARRTDDGAWIVEAATPARSR